MLTQDNYKNYLLEEYKPLDRIIQEGSLDELCVVLQPNVNIIMAKEHFVTPLLVALFNHREEIIVYLTNHQSMYMPLFRGVYNPILYALKRIQSNNNPEYVNTLLHMLTKDCDLAENEVANLLEQGGFTITTQNLISLLKAYKMAESDFQKIIFQNDINLMYAEISTDHLLKTYWGNLRDQNILKMAVDAENDFYSALLSNANFRKIAELSILSFLYSSDSQPNKLGILKACMSFGSTYLRDSIPHIKYDQARAMKYFKSAADLATTHSLPLTDADKLFFAAHELLIASKGSKEAKLSVEHAIDELDLKFILALQEPAKLGSNAALAYLRDSAMHFSQDIDLVSLLACHIHNLYIKPQENKIKNPMMLQYADLVTGYCYLLGIGCIADFDTAFSCFERVTNFNRDTHPSLSIFAASSAQHVIERKLAAIFAVPSLQQSKPLLDSSNDETWRMGQQEKKSAEISCTINDAMHIFTLQMLVSEVESIGVNITNHYKKILAFAGLSNKYSDQKLILKTVLDYYQSQLLYFVGSIEDDILYTKKKELNKFFAAVRDAKLLENLHNFEVYIKVLHHKEIAYFPVIIRNAIIAEFKLLISMADKKENKSLQYRIYKELLDIYYSFPNPSIKKLKEAIAHFENFNLLHHSLKIPDKLNKYAIFYFKLGENLPAEKIEDKFHNFSNAVILGKREALFKILNLIDNSSVEYNRKTAFLEFVLNRSLYPADVKFLIQLQENLAAHIKLKYAWVDEAQQNKLKSLNDLAMMARQCAEESSSGFRLLFSIKKNYLPALIKLTLIHIDKKNTLLALYCCSRLFAELVLNKEEHKNKYCIEEGDLIDLKVILFNYVNDSLNGNAYLSLAKWSSGFMTFVSALQIEKEALENALPANVAKLRARKEDMSMDDDYDEPFPELDRLSICIEALIIGNAENSIALPVLNDIKHAMKSFLDFKDANITILIKKYFAMRSIWGDRIVYETDEDLAIASSFEIDDYTRLREISEPEAKYIPMISVIHRKDNVFFQATLAPKIANDKYDFINSDNSIASLDIDDVSSSEVGAEVLTMQNDHPVSSGIVSDIEPKNAAACSQFICFKSKLNADKLFKLFGITDDSTSDIQAKAGASIMDAGLDKFHVPR